MSNGMALFSVPVQGEYCLHKGTPGLRELILRAAIMLVLCLTSPSARADGGYLSMGVGGGPEDAWSWQSISWAPFSSIDHTGVLIKAAVRTETKTYTTELPGRTNARIWAQGIGGDAEIGWQWVDDWGRISAWAGVGGRGLARLHAVSIRPKFKAGNQRYRQN
jgi:hypothetical protein